MALQMATFLKGRVNNLVFYQRGGSYIVRTMPAKVRQSANTKKRTSNFCMAATAGKLLRRQLGNRIAGWKDKKMQNRLGGAISKWIGTQDIQALPPQEALPYLSAFQFNEASTIAERWKLDLTVTALNEATLQVHIPAFTPTQVFAAPAHTSAINCIVSVAGCNLQQLLQAGSSGTETLKYTFTATAVPAQTLTLPVNLETGCLAITTVTIEFITAKGPATAPAFMTSGIIDARYC